MCHSRVCRVFKSVRETREMHGRDTRWEPELRYEYDLGQLGLELSRVSSLEIW